MMAQHGCNLILHGRTAEHCGEVLEKVRSIGVEAYAVGAFVDDKKSGRYLNAPFFTGLTLKQAVEKAEREFDSPYDK